MDKVLELVIAATVIILTAASVMFMMSDRSQKFSDWSNDTVSEGECSLDKAQFQNACDCDAPNTKSTQKSERIFNDADDRGCAWTEGTNSLTCENYC